MRYHALLPDEVWVHIEEVATKGPLSELVPCGAGASATQAQAQPFLQPPEASLPCQSPSSEDRALAEPWLLPETLRRVYAKYPPHVELRDAAARWHFLSETEIVERAAARRRDGQHRMVDLAVRYAGMGHVQVLAYDPIGERVFVDADGESDGFERLANLRRRNAERVGTRTDTRPFDDWWAHARE